MSQNKNSDLESQPPKVEKAAAKLSRAANSEYNVTTRTKWGHLGVYFLCNVALTIYNKAVLGKFPYPWLLTTLHAGSASIGCGILLVTGRFSLTPLSYRDTVTLVAFSFLFTINIAASNVSLSMVSMPFHQILRSTCPIFTILIYRLRYKRSYSTKTYLSLVPIVFGVALATYGDYYFTNTGFVLTLLGVVLAAIKTVATNRLMTSGSLALPPLEVLFRMSPLAFIQGLLYSLLNGELRAFHSTLNPPTLTPTPTPSPLIFPTNLLLLPPSSLALALLGNGALAFVLNISSFSTNKHAGALTMAVCGNVKQCLTVLLGIVVFGLKVGLLNRIGMAIALAGAAGYSMVELDSKGRKGKDEKAARG